MLYPPGQTVIIITMREHVLTDCFRSAMAYIRIIIDFGIVFANAILIDDGRSFMANFMCWARSDRPIPIEMLTFTM